ncbi:MAG: Asp-tRNA(Asn)/Glu-tRNA(Gln) amidotransferase subunit GatA [Acidobacteriota bacterium]
MSETWQLSARDLASSIAAGELSAESVVARQIERIRAVEGDVGAFLTVDDSAVERAREVDLARTRSETLGPLAGVPVAIKDNMSWRGRPLSCGSKLLEGYTAAYSATAVERLEDAGAIIVGSTNMDEFAMGSSCENSALQETRNPWDLNRVPGGSSGGSAAAVAAQQVPLAYGSDTGGSIRQPAAFCGCVGLKPTYGRISRYGLVAFASSLDQIGPMTRTVADAAVGLQVMAGHDARDSTSATAPTADYLAGLEHGIEGLRVGTLNEIDLSSLPTDVREDWLRSLDVLEGLGAEIVEVSVPSVRAAIAIYYVLANSEASANLARFDGVRYGARVDSGTLASLYTESRSRGFGAEVKRRIMLGTYALSSGYYDAYYGRAEGVARTLRRELRTAFQDVDVIATPTSPSSAFGLGERTDNPLEMYLSDIFTTPANLAGLPGLALPSGLDDEGMPLSLQLLGPAFSEAQLLRVGHAFETAADFPAPPEPRRL